MRLLEIIQAVAVEIGIEQPATATSSDPDMVRLTRFINDAGCEAIRRVDWLALRKIASLTGAGSSIAYPIGEDFDRLPVGLSVSVAGMPVRGSLTPDEWFSLDAAQGIPRYFFLSNAAVSFYPYPRSGDPIRVQYQSNAWVKKADDSLATKMDADDDVAIVPGDVVVSGAVWRWRRQVGKDFADEMAEFEAVLTDRARYDGGVRQP